MKRPIAFRTMSILVAAGTVAALAACGGGQDAAAPADGEARDGWVDAADLDLSGLGFDDDAEEAVRDLYQEAHDSGEESMMMYGSNHTLREPLRELFMERFPGTELETTELVGPQLQSTLETERSTGQNIGDQMENAGGARYASLGFSEQYLPPAFVMPEGLSENMESHMKGAEDGYVTAQWSLFGVGVNTDKMDPADVPTDWAELADPQWKDKIVMHDPSVPGGGQGFLSRLYLSGAIDDATLEGIADNVALKGEFAQTIQSLSQGEYPMMIGVDAPYVSLNKARGVPVEIVFMDEENIAMPQQSFVMKDAPHPNTARLWLNWIFSEEAQAVIAEAGNTPVVDVPSPHGLPAFSDANLAEIPSQEALDSEAEMISEKFGEVFQNR
ncbi:ABC transporter substrate-binding protein [Microbacterium faecale]|nr:extracellular solute-binding protein [Microbacterium faecale]